MPCTPLFMALWIGGLPGHRWPKLTLAYGIYAVVFVLISQISCYRHDARSPPL